MGRQAASGGAICARECSKATTRSVRGLGLTVNCALSSYFERRLHEDWGELLYASFFILPAPVIILRITAEIKTLVFKHRVQRADGEWSEVSSVQALSMIVRAMKAGERTLKEERELQYDIENCVTFRSGAWSATHTEAP